MAYIVGADFREGSTKWYTAGCVLSEEIADGDITAAIASFSAQLDSWCDDHFEAEAAVAYTLDVQEHSRRLYLPRRCRSVTSVKTVDSDGVETVEDATTYRLHSSLNATGTEKVGDLDWLEIRSGERLSTGGWPIGTGTVIVTGNWSYATVPERVKRAVALLVYNHFRAKGDSLHRAQRWTTEGGASFDASLTTPSGLPEVDAIIADLRHGSMA